MGFVYVLWTPLVDSSIHLATRSILRTHPWQILFISMFRTTLRSPGNPLSRGSRVCSRPNLNDQRHLQETLTKCQVGRDGKLVLYLSFVSVSCSCGPTSTTLRFSSEMDCRNVRIFFRKLLAVHLISFSVSRRICHWTIS